MFKSINDDIQRYYNKPIERKHGCSFIRKIIVIATNPGLLAIVNHRYGHWINTHCSKSYFLYLHKILHRLGKIFSNIWSKIEIQDETQIGPGFYISNKGGIILGANSIGRNCSIESIITIGLDLKGKKPIIGNDVKIMSDSVVYGNIKIGNGCIIGRNTVLTRTLPENIHVKGNPAKIIGKTTKND